MPGPESPYADTRAMYAVHNVFRREFGLLPDLVRSAPAKDEERVRIVADHVRLLCDFLHHHHSAEDAVLWPLLLARAPKEIDPVVHLVQGHHKNIDVLLTEVDARLAVWSGSTEDEDGEELANTLQRLVAAVYEHMDLEEKLVLPLAERHVFETEWKQMEGRAADAIAPEIAAVLVGMALYESGPEVLPPDMRDALAEVAPQAYAAYSERVHGTPTPPRATDLVLATPFVAVTGQRD